jgi:flavin reductase (DIM6/NTAB) family NADH-FMN oxidoreductase RutF
MPGPEQPMDKTAASALFAWLDREVWLVTARHGDRRGGLIATFVSQASLTPDLPRLVVGLARQHHTWQLIDASSAFAAHLLGQENLDWVTHFGLRSGHGLDKFEGWTTEVANTGSPILGGTVGWMDCKVEARLDTGDRTLFLGMVLESRVTNYGPPLTVKQLMQRLPTSTIGEMKRLMHRDSDVDAQAILAWREKNGIPSEPLL